MTGAYFTRQVHGYVEPFWVLVEDSDGEAILHHEYAPLSFSNPLGHSLRFRSTCRMARLSPKAEQPRVAQLNPKAERPRVVQLSP